MPANMPLSMTTGCSPAAPTAFEFTPRLMPAPAAARYMGVSVSTLRALELPRKELGAKRLYDRADLDAYADTLPYEARDARDERSCEQADAAWGG